MRTSRGFGAQEPRAPHCCRSLTVGAPLVLKLVGLSASLCCALRPITKRLPIRVLAQAGCCSAHPSFLGPRTPSFTQPRATSRPARLHPYNGNRPHPRPFQTGCCNGRRTLRLHLFGTGGQPCLRADWLSLNSTYGRLVTHIVSLVTPTSK